MKHAIEGLLIVIAILITILSTTIVSQLKHIIGKDIIIIQGLEAIYDRNDEKLEIFKSISEELATLNSKFVAIENDGMVFDKAWDKNHKNSMKKITKKPEGFRLNPENNNANDD